MLKRITLMIDEDLVRRLRERQADQIKKSHQSVSLSKVINTELRKSLKKHK